jgi:hypothetical protein
LERNPRRRTLKKLFSTLRWEEKVIFLVAFFAPQDSRRAFASIISAMRSMKRKKFARDEEIEKYFRLLSKGKVFRLFPRKSYWKNVFSTAVEMRNFLAARCLSCRDEWNRTPRSRNKSAHFSWKFSFIEKWKLFCFGIR